MNYPFVVSVTNGTVPCVAVLVVIFSDWYGKEKLNPVTRLVPKLVPLFINIAPDPFATRLRLPPAFVADIVFKYCQHSK